MNSTLCTFARELQYCSSIPIYQFAEIFLSNVPNEKSKNKEIIAMNDSFKIITKLKKLAHIVTWMFETFGGKTRPLLSPWTIVNTPKVLVVMPQEFW